MKFLVGFLAVMSITLQLSGIALVGWIIYFIYTNGLKALIDGIWMGFGI